MERSPQYMGRGGLYITGLALLKAFVQDPRIKVILFAEPPPAQILAFAREHLVEGTYNIYDNSEWRLILGERKAREKIGRAKARKQWERWFVSQVRRLYYAAACRLLRITSEKAFRAVDIWFSPIHQPPREASKVARIQKFVLLHDVIPLVEGVPDESKLRLDESHWHARLVKGINPMDYYFTNSSYTKRDFLHFVKTIDPAKIRVTYLACANHFKPSRGNLESLFQKYHLPPGKRYVFSLCSIDPRKNLIRASRVFVEFIKKHQIDDLILVLGGSPFSFFKEEFDREVKGYGTWASSVIQVGYIDEADLPSFYSHAEWFVYTSQYEGFGLPPLEAMACGCPVITSNATSLPEVVGNAGLMVDWMSDEEHLKVYETYYFNQKIRSEMARKGMERAKCFSWKRCADEMIETFISVSAPT